MGRNPWSPERWRAYNASTGDRHVTRRLPPRARWDVLREDLAQQRELAKLSRKRSDDPDLYKRREMAFIRLTRPMVYVMTGDDDDQ